VLLLLVERVANQEAQAPPEEKRVLCLRAHPIPGLKGQATTVLIEAKVNPLRDGSTWSQLTGPISNMTAVTDVTDVTDVTTLLNKADTALAR
jgi:hypothetical protein